MRGKLKLEHRPGEPGPVLFLVAEGLDKPRRVKDGSLDPALRGRPADELDGLEVEFATGKGQVRDVRPAGSVLSRLTPPEPAPSTQPVFSGRVATDRFHNPYTFIPTPPRPTSGPLADGEPPGHDRLAPDRWTGRISVVMCTESPLLLLDTASPRPSASGPSNHLVYGVRKSPGGEPDLAPTSVKGMLRSAYEAVTNSRFGVFTGHSSRLAYRMAADEGLRMVPVRVSDDGHHLQLLPGTTPVGSQGSSSLPLHAAWLPCYRSPVKPKMAHGSEVVAVVELVQHHRWDKRAQRHVADFRFWQVRALAPASAGAPPRALPAVDGGRVDGRNYHQPLQETKVVRGWVFITNQNIGPKHDERVFFVDGPPPPFQPLTDGLRRQWLDVVKSYRDAHSDADLFDREDKGRRVGPEVSIGRNPGQTAWSPHTYAGRRGTTSGRERLDPGSLCYARLGTARGTPVVTGLFPVCIARELFAASPDELLDAALAPAGSLADLSPADRVFGWVNPGKGDDAAYRGNLRLGPITCADGAAAIEEFPDSVPLAILGQPKPQQGRFYVGETGPAGASPLRSGAGKDEWYLAGAQRSLRGRKAYPRHASLPEGYWGEPWKQWGDGVARRGHFQEYRRLGGLGADEEHRAATRDSQNRSIEAWVRPGTTFRFNVDVKNLSEVELGALLFLLTLPDGHTHRLGLGKPLGFGSVAVTVDWDGTRLAPGGAPDSEPSWTAWYRSLAPAELPAAPRTRVEESVGAFRQAVAPGASFENVGFIRAFLAVTAGDPTTPVHYPRVRPEGMGPDEPAPPDPDLPAYEWFVANERRDRGAAMAERGVSLPMPGAPGLPLHPARNAPGRAGDRRGGPSRR